MPETPELLATRDTEPAAPRRESWVAQWLGDSALMLSSQLLLSATAFLVMLLVARNLSKEQFGFFSSLLGISTALSFIVDSGITTWLLRTAAEERSQSDRPLADQNRRLVGALERTTAITGGSGLLLAIAAGCVAAIVGLGSQLALAQAFFVVYVTLLAWNTAFEAVLRGDRRVRLVVAANAIERFSLLLLIGVVVLAGGGVLAMSVAYLIAGTLRLAQNHRAIRRYVGVVVPRRRRGTLALVRETGPFAANSAALSFFPRIDTAIVGAFSLAAASYFAIGYQIVTTIALVPLLAATSLYPFLARGHLNVGSRRRISVIMCVAGIVISGVGIVVAPWLIPLLFGEQYRAAVGTVQIALLGVPAVFIAGPILTFLYGVGRERQVTRWVLAPSLFGTGLVIAGVAEWGAEGAAAGLAVRYGLQALTLAILDRRARRIA